MSAGFFNEGRIWVYRKAFKNELSSTTLHVGLYTNSRESLTNRNVLADIVACAGAGYAPVALAAADWSTSLELGATPNDDSAQLDRANVIITASAAWGVVRGAYLFDQSTGIAIAWRDGHVDYDMVTGAKYLVDWLSDLF